MVSEKYLQRAINIRRTYLKLINSMELYRARALQVSERLNDTLKKLDEIKEDAKPDAKKRINENDLLNRMLKIIEEIEDEGKRLEKLIDPVNSEIEKLAKEESELYRQIVDNHPKLSEDDIVKSVRDRLIKEGLS